jgi:hypothetical protein
MLKYSILGSILRLPFTGGMFLFEIPRLQDSGKFNFRNTSMQAREEKDFTEQEMEI